MLAFTVRYQGNKKLKYKYKPNSPHKRKPATFMKEKSISAANYTAFKSLRLVIFSSPKLHS